MTLVAKGSKRQLSCMPAQEFLLYWCPIKWAYETSVRPFGVATRPTNRGIARRVLSRTQDLQDLGQARLAGRQPGTAGRVTPFYMRRSRPVDCTGLVIFAKDLWFSRMQLFIG